MTALYRLMVLLPVFGLAGCPAYFTATLKNESVAEITVGESNTPSDGEVIEPHSTKTIYWRIWCQELHVNGVPRYLVADGYPEEAVEYSGFRETRLGLVFDKGKFYYRTDDGSLTQVTELESCQ